METQEKQKDFIREGAWKSGDRRYITEQVVQEGQIELSQATEMAVSREEGRKLGDLLKKEPAVCKVLEGRLGRNLVGNSKLFCMARNLEGEEGCMWTGRKTRP